MDLMDDEGSLYAAPVAMPRPRLLAVDDHPANLLVLTRNLQSLDVDVITASSGAQALVAAADDEFAAILLDVQMPDMDGFETARRLREQLGKTPTPIIFITANDRTHGATMQGYASGAIDFLYKPVDRVLLTSKLNVLLELYRHRQQLAEATRALRHMNRQMSQLLRAVGDGILGVAENGCIAFANPAACALLEAHSQDLVGQALHEVTRCALFDAATSEAIFDRAEAEHPYRTETLFHTGTGGKLVVEFVLSVVAPQDGQQPSWVLIFRDISERQEAVTRLREQAERDALTGLANRAYFHRSATELLAGASAQNLCFGVLFIDLDGFKKINDLFGHACGDEVLVAIGQRLQRAVPATHLVARLGGDEFGVLLPTGTDANDALELGEALIVAIGAPHLYPGKNLTVGASIGAAMYPEHADTLAPLLRAADIAMYAAKADGAAGILLATPAAR